MSNQLALYMIRAWFHIVIYFLPFCALSQTDTSVSIVSVIGPDFSYDGLNYSNDCTDTLRATKRREYINLVSAKTDSTESIKAAAIERAIATARWMNCLLAQNEFTIVVNIPSATLLLYHYDSIILESKVIVGKKSTRTPVFASVVTDITLYPYWMVPKSIATKELLPEIKKDITYLERNGFQVLDKNGRITNPAKINWNDLRRDSFPYTLRQSTGCDNSLGLIKLNVNHPYNIYLHDTPWKNLFDSQRRFYSHGCIRVQKAKELSHILLKDNSIAVDTLNEKASGIGHNPQVLKLPTKIPILVLYNTAWYGKEGVVRFYPDVYGRQAAAVRREWDRQSGVGSRQW